jgi:hypothetical protein
MYKILHRSKYNNYLNNVLRINYRNIIHEFTSILYNTRVYKGLMLKLKDLEFI